MVWRLGLVLGAANLTLLGVGLSASNPRRASNWNLLFALLSFVVYYNFINLSQAWVAGGKLGMGTALVLLHGGAFVLALTLLWWREQTNARMGWRRVKAPA
jgi:lipopolysaccharide export system permease protein